MPERMRWGNNPLPIIIPYDKMASIFGLPSWDSVNDSNQEYLWEAARAAYQEAIDDDNTEEQAEDIRSEAEMEASADLYGQWKNGVERVADEVFGLVDLEVEDDKKRGSFNVVAKGGDWRNTAMRIYQVVKGIGYDYGSLEDALSATSSASVAEFVKSHWKYVADYPAVYGHPNVHRIYESSWR